MPDYSLEQIAVTPSMRRLAALAGVHGDKKIVAWHARATRERAARLCPDEAVDASNTGRTGSVDGP